LRQMVELYLEHGAERVRSLTEAAAAGDVNRVERAAHTMKSSAANLGAVRLRHTAEAVEMNAAADMIDSELVARLVREYEESAGALRRVLEEQTS
ncbi:MAG: Hpt domain-containing protein, partial [Longimicrobiales bacterium]